MKFCYGPIPTARDAGILIRFSKLNNGFVKHSNNIHSVYITVNVAYFYFVHYFKFSKYTALMICNLFYAYPWKLK